MANEKMPKLSVFRPGEEGLEQTLGTLEAQVMNAVWDLGRDVSVEAVRLELEVHGKKAAYTTVMTTMSRLYKKGLLTREMRGKAYFYSASISREALDTNVVQTVIDGLLTTFAEPAMSYFVDALNENDPNSLDSLSKIIDEKRKAQGGH